MEEAGPFRGAPHSGYAQALRPKSIRAVGELAPPRRKTVGACHTEGLLEVPLGWPTPLAPPAPKPEAGPRGG